MGWEDRPYYRDGGGEGSNPFRFLLYGSVPLFTAFRIRVRAHISLIIFIAFVLLLGAEGKGAFVWQERAEFLTMLFAIVLLHEFGHCFVARWVGGDAEEIVMTPLGGAAFATPPHRPWPTFLTVAGGPAVNVLICLVTAIALYFITGRVPWNPGHYLVTHRWVGWYQISNYLFWIYATSLGVLLFNLLPIFPFDGGRLVQAILWPKFGYYRSMKFACITGIIGGILLAIFGLKTGSVLLIFIAGSGIITCVMTLRMVREMGPELDYASGSMDFSASLRPDKPGRKRRKVSRWTIRRLRRQSKREADEQARIDAILAKVSSQGMHRLTWSERRALKRATERQRQQEVELSRKF